MKVPVLLFTNVKYANDTIVISGERLPLSMLEIKSNSKSQMKEWWRRNRVRIEWTVLLVLIGYIGAGIAGALAELGLILTIVFCSVAFPWLEAKSSLAFAKIKSLYSSDEVERRVYVMIRRPKELDIELDTGGKIWGETRHDTKAIKQDTYPEEAINQTWKEYASEGYIVVNYVEVNPEVEFENPLIEIPKESWCSADEDRYWSE